MDLDATFSKLEDHYSSRLVQFFVSILNVGGNPDKSQLF